MNKVYEYIGLIVVCVLFPCAVVLGSFALVALVTHDVLPVLQGQPGPGYEVRGLAVIDGYR